MREPSCGRPHRPGLYNHLMTRVDPKSIEKMIKANKQSLAPTPAVAAATRRPRKPRRKAKPAAAAPTATDGLCTVDDS